MNAKFQKLFHKLTYGHAASAFFGIFNGRTTFFAIAFSIAGVYGWLRLNRDLTSFALFAGSIQALLTVKSGLDDYHQRATSKTIVHDTTDPNQEVTTIQNNGS